MMGFHSPKNDRAALEAQAQTWIVRLTSGQATAADAEAFKRWCEQSPAHASAMSAMTHVWDVARPAGEAFVRQVRQAQSRSAYFGRRAFLGSALAAGAAYLFVRPPLQLWPGVSDFTADYRTRTGEQRQVVVNDSVVVEMNTQTSINLLRNTGDGQGSVHGMELLSGEAQVSLRSPLPAAFTVLAQGGRVVASDVGQFNVRATDATVCLTCLAGRVELETAGRTIVAGPKEQIRYADGHITQDAHVDPAAVTAWRQQLLVFNAAPLVDVVAEINRYRSGRIIVTNATLGHRTVQAQIRLDQLSEIVDLIRTAYGAQVTTLPGGIVLLS